MADLEFVEQLVDSMESAVLKLESAVESGNKEEENKLRVFIFDLHRRVADAVEEIDGRWQGADSSSLPSAQNLLPSAEKKVKKKKRKARKRLRKKNV